MQKSASKASFLHGWPRTIGTFAGIMLLLAIVKAGGYCVCNCSGKNRVTISATE
jgi:hypothetical protein